MKSRHTASMCALMTVAGMTVSAFGQTLPHTPEHPRKDAAPQMDPKMQPRDDMKRDVKTGHEKVTKDMMDRTVQGWPEKQREQITKISAKYGMPTSVTADCVTWKDPAPFKCITIERESVTHKFPMEHPDFMRFTVSHRIPAEKVSDIIASDGSVTVDRTGGCLSAKCDTEPHVLLGLNLAHDIIMGAKTMQQARDEHARIAMLEKQGQSHPYLEKLQFQPDSDAKDPDMPARPMPADRTMPADTTMPNEKKMPDRK